MPYQNNSGGWSSRAPQRPGGYNPQGYSGGGGWGAPGSYGDMVRRYGEDWRQYGTPDPTPGAGDHGYGGQAGLGGVSPGGPGGMTYLGDNTMPSASAQDRGSPNVNTTYSFGGGSYGAPQTSNLSNPRGPDLVGGELPNAGPATYQPRTFPYPGNTATSGAPYGRSRLGSLLQSALAYRAPRGARGSMV